MADRSKMEELFEEFGRILETLEEHNGDDCELWCVSLNAKVGSLSVTVPQSACVKGLDGYDVLVRDDCTEILYKVGDQVVNNGPVFNQS